MNQHLCTVLLIIALTSNCGDLVSAVGCDELDYNTDYTEVCKGSPLEFAYCPPGKRLIDPCEGTCDYCPTGQYQNSYNTCETCRNCTTRADCDKCDGHLIGQCSSKTNAKCGCPICPTCETCPTPPEGNIPPTQEDTTPVVSCPPVEPCPPVVPCPPVEPCPSVSPQPDKESLGSCNDSVHKWWRIWGILAIIIFLLLLLGFLIHLGYCKWQSGQQEGYEGIPTNGQEMYPPNNGNDPAAGNDTQGITPGGSGSTHDATPPEGSDQGPSPPQGAEGGDPSPGITSESFTNQEGMTSDPEADGGDVKLTVDLSNDESDQGPSSIQVAKGGDPTPGSQLQFSNAAIGNVLITEEEINDVAEEVYKHMGTYYTGLDRFCSKFGMDGNYYRRVLEEKKSSSAQDQLFYAIVHWHAQNPQTKEAFRKSLCKVDKRLGIWYVGYVNDQENDQQ
ncbi:uncharacterized protein [Apostichopus japonicus]|uniref:uncharacterized protein isoform X3 n=1 Tax=Stichopus japonicus TaxID=307972 RepID=UPI003AB5A9BB